MGGEQAASVLLTVRKRSLEAQGKSMTKEEEEKFLEPILQKYEHEASPYFSSSRIWDDGIFDPVDTRKVLGLCISSSLNAPIPDQKYGVFRM